MKSFVQKMESPVIEEDSKQPEYPSQEQVDSLYKEYLETHKKVETEEAKLRNNFTNAEYFYLMQVKELREREKELASNPGDMRLRARVHVQQKMVDKCARGPYLMRSQEILEKEYTDKGGNEYESLSQKADGQWSRFTEARSAREEGIENEQEAKIFEDFEMEKDRCLTTMLDKMIDIEGSIPEIANLNMNVDVALESAPEGVSEAYYRLQTASELLSGMKEPAFRVRLLDETIIEALADCGIELDPSSSPLIRHRERT